MSTPRPPLGLGHDPGGGAELGLRQHGGEEEPARPTCWPTWSGRACSRSRRWSLLSLATEGAGPVLARPDPRQPRGLGSGALAVGRQHPVRLRRLGLAAPTGTRQASTAPMALLVPVFGLGASVLRLGEPLPAWKLIAAGLVVGGLAINMLGPRLRRAT